MFKLKDKNGNIYNVVSPSVKDAMLSTKEYTLVEKTKNKKEKTDIVEGDKNDRGSQGHSN